MEVTFVIEGLASVLFSKKQEQKEVSSNVQKMSLFKNILSWKEKCHRKISELLNN